MREISDVRVVVLASAVAIGLTALVGGAAIALQSFMWNRQVAEMKENRKLIDQRIRTLQIERDYLKNVLKHEDGGIVWSVPEDPRAPRT